MPNLSQTSSSTKTPNELAIFIKGMREIQKEKVDIQKAKFNATHGSILNSLNVTGFNYINNSGGGGSSQGTVGVKLQSISPSSRRRQIGMLGTGKLSMGTNSGNLGDHINFSNNSRVANQNN